MKKKFVVFLMAVMMSFSAMCYASYGTDLDSETKIVDQFLSGGDYGKISSFMDSSLAKDLTADKYKELFGNMNKELGKMVKKDLRIYYVFEDAHVLSYATKFEKGKIWGWDFQFKIVNGKPYIITLRSFEPNAQAQANSNKEKK